MHYLCCAFVAVPAAVAVYKCAAMLCVVLSAVCTVTLNSCVYSCFHDSYHSILLSPLVALVVDNQLLLLPLLTAGSSHVQK
jgi:hypothetical protein